MRVTLKENMLQGWMVCQRSDVSQKRIFADVKPLQKRKVPAIFKASMPFTQPNRKFVKFGQVVQACQQVV